jgi:hypothetical protein
MKVPVDELNISIRLDGLALVKHASGAALEQLIRPGMVEVVLRALEAEGRAERGSPALVIGDW